MLNIFSSLKWHWQKRTLTLNSVGMLFNPYLFSLPCFYSLPLPPPHPPSLAKCVPYLYSHPYHPPQLSVENKSLWRPVTTAGSTTSANCPPFFKDLPFNFRRPWASMLTLVEISPRPLCPFLTHWQSNLVSAVSLFNLQQNPKHKAGEDKSSLIVALISFLKLLLLSIGDTHAPRSSLNTLGLVINDAINLLH